MRSALIPMFAICVLAIPATGQATKPADALAKENAELKQRIEELEAYVAKLEAKLRERKPSSPRADARPFRPAPYGYELPAPPFRLPAPVPAPRGPRSEGTPREPTTPVPAGHPAGTAIFRSGELAAA